MNKIIFIALLLLLFTACGGKQNNESGLYGDIKGLGNDTLYVYGTDYFYNRIDTIVAKEGKFTATPKPDTLVTTRLHFPNGTDFPLFIDKNSQIKINGSYADINMLEVTGNAPNEEYTAFRKELKGMTAPSQKKIEEKADLFIRSHPTSLVSIYLLDQYFVQNRKPNYQQIQQLTNSMSGVLKDRPFIDNLLQELRQEELTSVGKSAPYFYMTNPQGKRIARSNFSQKHLLIHFWASWDSLSRKQNEVYKRIYQKEKNSKDFALLGISLDLDAKAWKQCIKQDTLKWEQICDFGGWQSTVITQFAVRTLPYNILISPAGIIEAKNLDKTALEQKLKELRQ